MKRIKRESGTHNILYYVCVYFIIVMFIIGVMGGYFYYFLYGTVYSDFRIGNEQHLAEIVNRHENDMQIIDDIVMQMELDEEEALTKFRLEDEPKKSDPLTKRLKGYTTVSQFFDMMFYHYHKDDYLYNHLTSVNLKFFLESGCFFGETDVLKVESLLKEKTAKMHILPEQLVFGRWINIYLSGRERYTVIFRTIPPSFDDTLMFIVPDTYYDDLLGDGLAGRRKDFLYYDGQLIVSRGSELLSEEELVQLLSNVDMVDWFIEMENGQGELSVGKDRYLLSLHKGESGIYYGTLQSMSVFADKIKTEQWVVLLLMLVCVCTTFLVIMLASKRVIKKVKGLNQLLNEDSWYDLNSIENGIQSLVMTKKASEKESLTLKKTRFIRNFIRGDFANREEAVLEARKAELNIDYEKYVVVLLRNREINSENKAYSFMLETIALEEMTEGYGIHLINNNQKLFVLFGDGKEVLEEVLSKMLEIEKKYCEEYVIAVSNIHTDFMESSKAYLEADTAFDNHLLMDNSRLIRFSDVVQKEYVSLVPENYLQRLRYAIRTCDKDAAEIAVKDICSKINGENISLYTFRIFYNEIIHILLSECKNNNERLDNFYNVFTLSQCLNTRDFYDLLCEICKVIIEKNIGNEVVNSNVAQKAIAYMMENYHDPELTMITLADYLKISSVILSVEFKNEMGISPSKYLANLRIEKAKELLKDTNMLVKEVSLAVGYEDDYVFRRWFKKYTGMTPGQYRGR